MKNNEIPKHEDNPNSQDNLDGSVQNIRARVSSLITEKIDKFDDVAEHPIIGVFRQPDGTIKTVIEGMDFSGMASWSPRVA